MEAALKLPEHLNGVTIYHSGSPELGYAGYADVLEYVESEAAEQDSKQLFPTSDPHRIERVARKAFRTMKFTAGMYIPEENGVFYGYHHDDALGTDVFELGVRTPNDEPVDLVNLDSFSRIICLQRAEWFLPRHELPKSRQATPIIWNFIIGKIIEKHTS